MTLKPSRALSAGAALVVLGAVALAVATHGSAQEPSGKLRQYFIQAEEATWDYAPDGRNRVTGEGFDADAAVFVERGRERVGSRYRKALFRGYTDASIKTALDQGERWEHLGMLGPVIHAEVGDVVEVVLRNDTRRPVSLHTHGLRYDKASEGAAYSDGTSGGAKADDAVKPGATRTYRWEVPERAGPAEHEGSSTMWMYMSHVDEVADQYAGLMGPIIVTRRGMARPDGTPTDVDRELVADFMVVDENASPYLGRNVRGLPRAVAVASTATTRRSSRAT